MALACTAPAHGNHVQCGDTVVTDTMLDSDLLCPEQGLIVGAADVTIDFDGHTLRGSDTEETNGITVVGGAELAGAVVRDGHIRNFPIGVLVEGVPDALVADMVFTQNSLGVACLYAPGCRIRDNVDPEQPSAGCAMNGLDPAAAEQRSIADNTVVGNGVAVKLTGDARARRPGTA